MSRPVALSRIEELGVRSLNAPAVQPTAWAGMDVNGGGVRALHEALHPTLLLLAYAGYHVADVVVAQPGDDNILRVTLSPHDAGPFSWAAYVGGAAAFPSTAPFAVAVPLDPRPGLTAQLVDVLPVGALAPFIRTAGARMFLVLDLAAAADLRDIADRVGSSQTIVRTELALRIAVAWATDPAGEVTTGLLSALLPDFWTFPRLPDPDDLRRQTFWQLGTAVTGDGFANQQALQAFLLEEAWVRDRVGPPSVHDRLHAAVPADAGNLEQAWNNEAQALWDLAFPDANQRPPFQRADHRRLSFSELVFDMLNEGLLSLAGYGPPEDEPAYGGFDLQKGDNDPTQNDNQWTYGGQQVVRDPALPLPEFVQELRRDLTTVGFGPLADGDPAVRNVRRAFGAFLESAVREFQIYAAMPNVARFATPQELAAMPPATQPSLATTLVQQPNDQPYTGPACGVLNAETRALLKMWVERDWHCPVVVEARELPDAALTLLRNPNAVGNRRAAVTDVVIDGAHQNLWRRDAVTDQDLHFIAWDFTDHYPQAAGRSRREPVVVAKWDSDYWGGPYGPPPDCTWSEAEIRPDNLLGAWPDPARRHDQNAFWSTYRVVAAVGEVESMGVLDGMNAYDSAILSGGPFHWTLGLCRLVDGAAQNNPDDCVIYRGELCPAMTYLAADSPGDFATFFEDFGIRTVETWADPPVALYSTAHRKYRGWITLQNEDGAWVDPRERQPATVAAGARPQVSNADYELAEVLHHWHWIYRWQMAPRLSPRLRRLMWNLARARIRALLATPWPGRAFTIGDVFRSEMSVALLLRSHVFSPPWVLGVDDLNAEWLNATGANITLRNLIRAYDHVVAQGAAADPALWGDAQEELLVTRLVATTPADQLDRVQAWPDDQLFADRAHDPALPPLAREEAPDIGPLQPLIAAPGAQTIAGFTITDRETAPQALRVAATSGDAAVLPVAVRHRAGNDFELVLDPPAGAPDTEVRVTVTADDRRQAVTSREVVVHVTAGNAPPAGVPAPYVRAANAIGLSKRRGSFELDATGLFQQPPG